MLNLEIKRVLKIRVYFTAKEWGLDHEEFPTDCAAFASSLNATLENYVNRGEDGETVSRCVRQVMARAPAIHGATKPRPFEFLDEVLDRIFAEHLVETHEPVVVPEPTVTVDTTGPLQTPGWPWPEDGS